MLHKAETWPEGRPGGRESGRLFMAVLIALAMSCLVGCVSNHERVERMAERIGEPRQRDVSGMGPYEIAVNGLLDHMSDTAVFLSEVTNPETSRRVAGLLDEAGPAFVRLRREMALSESDKQITSAELFLKYGGRYVWATIEIEQQLRRIKSIGPETHDPIKSALLRLRKQLEDAGLPSEL